MSLGHRTPGYITLLSTENSTGSVLMCQPSRDPRPVQGFAAIGRHLQVYHRCRVSLVATILPSARFQLPHRGDLHRVESGVRLQPRGIYIEALSAVASATECKAPPQLPAPGMGSTALWFVNLSAVLTADDFVANPHDCCAFNKIDPDGKQITLCLHVGCHLRPAEESGPLPRVTDLCIPNRDAQTSFDMTFDFTIDGEARVTMDSFTDAGC